MSINTQRRVWAVDVLASGVSLALIEEPRSGGVSDTPKIGKVDFDPPVNDFTPRTSWERSVAVADRVVEKIMSRGEPTLVVLAKQQWGSSTPVKVSDSRGRSRTAPVDESAYRRHMLQAQIEDRLHARGIPVGEFPYPTALPWFNDGQPSPRTDSAKVMTTIAAKVKDIWGLEQPVVEGHKKKIIGSKTVTETVYVRTQFRIQVVALAAIGAMAVGIETAVPVTEERLKIANGSGNKAVQFPASRRCPTDITVWDELRRYPNLLEVGA